MGYALDRGLSRPRDIVGETIIHRPRRDVGFPLVAGLVCGVLALGLLLAAFVTAGALAGGGVLVALEVLLGGGLGWLAVTLFADLRAHHRFNRRRHEVRFGVDGVEIDSTDGTERVALAEVQTHPLLRSLAIDDRVRTLMRVRAACHQQPPRSEVRQILETLALLHHEGEPGDDPKPPARPLYAIIRASGDVGVFTEDPDDPEDLDDARRSGLPLYRVRTDWDPDAHAHVPRLTPAALTRITTP